MSYEEEFFSANINNKEIYRVHFFPEQQHVLKAEMWGNLKWNVLLQIRFFFSLVKSPDRVFLMMKDEGK